MYSKKEKKSALNGTIRFSNWEFKFYLGIQLERKILIYFFMDNYLYLINCVNFLNFFYYLSLKHLHKFLTFLLWHTAFDAENRCNHKKKFIK